MPLFILVTPKYVNLTIISVFIYHFYISAPFPSEDTLKRNPSVFIHLSEHKNYTFDTDDVCMFKYSVVSLHVACLSSIQCSVQHSLFLFMFFYVFSLVQWLACLITDHEVAGSIPGTSTNFRCGLGRERGPPSLVRTIGQLLDGEVADLIKKVDIIRLDGA